MAALKLPGFEEGGRDFGDAISNLKVIEKHKCQNDLAYFVKTAWSIVEPGTPYVHGWHIDMICAHLEAITNGEVIDGRVYNRLLINVPPGMMKSLLVAVFWPAWEWGPKNMPSMRYVCLSHDSANSIRDSLRMRRLVSSEWYQAHWGDRVRLTGDQNVKTLFENSATGFRQVASFENVTGKRGDRIILDDPNSWGSANSEVQRMAVNEWFLGALQSRMNHPVKSAIIVIMQRLHEEDVSGVILEHRGKGLGYDHIMLPMHYDKRRAYTPEGHRVTTKLGYYDIREEEGELLFPERFPDWYVKDIESTMGPYEVAGQMQQEPVAKGGGIIKDDWWMLYTPPPERPDEYPPFDFIMASLDTAYTEKQENDYSAMTIWGVFSTTDRTTAITGMAQRYATRQQIERLYVEGAPNILLMYAWQERLSFPDLLKKVVWACKKYSVDKLIIENKAAGISLEQELRRVLGIEGMAIQLINPGNLDKVARLHSVSGVFSEGIVWAPEREWAETVIRQVSSFPKGKHDDLTDTVSQAVRHLRDIGILTRAQERMYTLDEGTRFRGKAPPPLYPV
jgi:predicted phage terminase large subunit-like protein